MGLIEESLAAAESRSKDIGRLIATQTTAATDTLEQEIKKLGLATDGQISHAAKLLRDQHERSVKSMNEMLAVTASDFQQTAQDMRVTAQQVVKDIDHARSELKRAILELPEETRSNADAMRRVVSDQISALNALADVVKRQSTTLDISGPGIYLSQNPRESSPGKSEGTPSTAPQTRTQGAQEIRLERTAAVPNDPPPAVLLERPVGELMKAAAAENSESLLPHLVREAGGETTEGRNIAREVEAMVSKLNGAARDLVEALDGNLNREFEKRYNAGEAHIYMHQLYLHRGPKLLKAIENRYGSVRLVRGRVDAFIRLFERLLDTMSESPSGEQMVDACLASESGKLYLLLAKASGRIQ
jgi:hypothetical protein